MADSDIHKVLRHHDQQLASLTTEVTGVKATLGEHSELLRKIDGSLTGLQARSPAGFRETVGTVKDSLVLLGILVGGVIFITGSYVNERAGKEIVALQEQQRSVEKTIDRIESFLGWWPRVDATKGGELK